jgi:hypothetical protein
MLTVMGLPVKRKTPKSAMSAEIWGGRSTRPITHPVGAKILIRVL